MNCTLDLPPAALAELERLGERLHHPSTDALVGFLVVQGMAAVWSQLEAAGTERAGA